MPFWSSFVGGFYVTRSTTFAADQAVNIYRETRQAEGSPKKTTFFGTPGCKLETSVAANTGNRGWFSQDGRTWTVIAATLYELMAGVLTEIDTIPDDGLPVFFASNGLAGNQLGISGGGAITVLDLVTGAVATAVLPFPDPVMLVFQDGYALANQRETPIVWFSALEDMLTWDALDFITRSGTSDNVVGLGVSKDRVRFFGSKTTTDYYDSGDIDTPFLPYSGTTSQGGLVSPYLLNVYRDVFYWVSSASRGQYKVVAGSDTAGQPISTPPIETWLAGATTLADARNLLYEQEGHVFFLITAPSSPDAIQTYGFDAIEKDWHARAGWDAETGVYTAWRAAGTTTVNGAVYVGDAANGRVYTLDLNTYDDNGAILRRERTAPYLSAENQWIFLDQFELGMQAGVGLSAGQGQAPVATLEISRDNAQTWVSAGAASLGAIGAYGARAIWRRLGRSRADRLVLRVTQTDPVKTAWIGAWLRTSTGSGQL